MPRLSVFLSLSVVLHLGGGMLLFGRDTAQAALPQVKAAAQPTVVQVMLAPAPAKPQPAVAGPVVEQVARTAEELPEKVPAKPVKAVKPARQALAVAKPKSPPAPARVPAPAARPESQPATQQTQAQAEKPAPQKSHSPAVAEASTSSKPAIVAAAAPAVEVLSHQPAFRLPPEQPRYPAQARRRNQQGVVLLEVRLDARGGQREIRLLRSSGFPSLDRAALEAVAEWRFHPEIINGQGVPSRVQIPVEFALMASR